MSNTFRRREYNDHRAAHRVYVLAPQLGTCVQIPYRDHTISLAADGENVFVFQDEYHHDLKNDGVYGTSGESIKAAMEHIDARLAA
jgi:hypothetical protein